MKRQILKNAKFMNAKLTMPASVLWGPLVDTMITKQSYAVGW